MLDVAVKQTSTTSPATSPASTRATWATARRSVTATAGASASSPWAARASAAICLAQIAAFPEAEERVPDLRMIVVAGPRIDPESLPEHYGLEIRV